MQQTDQNSVVAKQWLESVYVNVVPLSLPITVIEELYKRELSLLSLAEHFDSKDGFVHGRR